MPRLREATLAARHCCAAILFLLSAPALGQEGVFLSVEEFLARAFPQQDPQANTMWFDTERREAAETILNHRPPGLRLRYWGAEDRTAWIIEEIGKERPITIGVVIDGDAVERVDILAFRESRGGEVRYSFFTDQFIGERLRASDDYRLQGSIDGITGATLSVRAVTKVATLALYLHRQTPYGQRERAQ